MEIKEKFPDINIFHVGDWLIDPASCHIQRDGHEVKLEPKVMDVLLCLVEHQGQVVSRETLEAYAWKDMVVGYDALASSIIKLRKAFNDDSRNPEYIETIPKKGYRLIASVSPATEPQAAVTDAPVSQLPATQSRTKLTVMVVLSVLVVLSVVLVIFNRNESPQQATTPQAAGQPEKLAPSVVVLPFKNLSNDSKQDYFIDGITDDIITDLSRVGALRVVASQSANHFRDNPATLEEIAKKLDVLYIVQGSIQKAGQQVRINVQLTNTEKRETIWAERFDGDGNNLFDIQDEITKRVIDAMFVTLSNNENQMIATRTTNNFQAYDSFLLGQQHSRNRSPQGYEMTLSAYKQALQYDPDYARVYGAMAVLTTNAFRHKWSDLPIEEAKQRAMELVNKAVAMDQSSPQIYWSLGFVHLFRKEYEQAEAAAKKAIALSPNYADGLGLLAFISNWRGKSEEAARVIKKAMSLNPYHGFDYPWNLGFAYYTTGKYEEAVKIIQDALIRNETAEFPRMFLAASYVRLGRIDDAEWEIEQVKAQRPGTTISHLANTLPYENRQLMESFLEDMRKAGMEE